MSLGDIGNAIGNGVSKVARSAGREVDRALNEHVEHINEDFDSISKAIDERGLLGGALQTVDVFSPGHRVANDLDAWNVIPEDPALKELISAGVNVWVPGPISYMALKDVADAIGAIQGQGGPLPAPSPSHGAPAPHEVEPRGDGYPSCSGHSTAVAETQRASLNEIGHVLLALREMRAARAEFVKNNPDAPVPTDGHYTIDEILNHPSMSTGEVCCRVVHVIIHEHPEVLDQIGASTGTTAPQAPQRRAGEPSAEAPKSNTEAGQAVFGMFGQVASFLGPLLGNPMVGTLLAGVLAATPLAPIAPFLPFILPLAGGALTMLGGAATQISQGQDPTLSMPGAGGGASPDMLGGLLQAIPAMLGGVPGGAAPPVPGVTG